MGIYDKCIQRNTGYLIVTIVHLFYLRNLYNNNLHIYNKFIIYIVKPFYVRIYLLFSIKLYLFCCV